MKSGGPWNLRGLRRQTREAAQRSGISVGEWLNSVIEPDDDRAAPLRHRGNFSGGDRAERRRDDEAFGRGRGGEEAFRRGGGPYREAQSREHADLHYRRRERDRDFERDASRMQEELREAAREEIGEVNARLDTLSRQIERLARAKVAAPPPSGAPPRRPVVEDAAPGRALSIEQAVAEITARQRALDDGEAAAPPPPAAAPSDDAEAASFEAGPFETPPPSSVDLSGLEGQLRQITTRIEALRPQPDLEQAMYGLRGDLSEIGRLLTEALPRRAVESLEIEIKALAQRIDHSRQSGVDGRAVAGLERGLTEVREVLRGLTTAESLSGVGEAVKALAQKLDVIAAKDDPAALRQLESAIGALRGIVSHVASNDALSKIAEDVRALAAKVDGFANAAASGHAISALENRIDTLANALSASTEAGHAVPRELEKLLAGLIEKLEWVQLTHTDHAALAHLEDRIAMLVKRLDLSDARLSQLDGVERGLTDLLVHLEQMRGGNGKAAGGANGKPAVATVERDVAAIKASERRTQDSLEAVQGTVEHVVDRLAMIESDMRSGKQRSAPAPPLASLGPASPGRPPHAGENPGRALAVPVAAAPAAPKAAAAEPVPPRAAAPRPPIDPNLPPDHPLEPGSAGGRSRQPRSAAERIAASEAAIGNKPPVIPDPGGKPDFIAAARRAARTAALAAPERQKTAEPAAAKATPLPKGLSQRLRTLIVAAAAVLLTLGCLRVAPRLFDFGGAHAPARMHPTKSTRPLTVPTQPMQLTPPPVAPAIEPASDAAAAPPATVPVPREAPARPPRQSFNDAPDFSTATAPPPPGAAALWSVPDYTGSLPRTAAAPTVAFPDDKLPATIGGPALRAAALAGDPGAEYEVAVRFAEGHGVTQNAGEAAHWFERAAKAGLAPAQFRLGGFYEKGVGVPKNLVAARDLYRAAAEKGHGKAMHNLAVLYAEGVDGAADYRTAAHWFRKAADCGIGDSQYNLGILYARGIGVEQNYAQAYKWFALAAKHGDKEAAKKRDEVASHLDRESLAAARMAVLAWRVEPQPADAVTVNIPAAWRAPAEGRTAHRSRPRWGDKAPQPDFSKLNDN